MNAKSVLSVRCDEVQRPENLDEFLVRIAVKVGELGDMVTNEHGRSKEIKGMNTVWVEFIIKKASQFDGAKALRLLADMVEKA